MVSEEKRSEFLRLYTEFTHEYLSQSRGQEHLQRYGEGRTKEKKNFEETREEVRRTGVVPTEKVLQKLLPHTDSSAHQKSGTWVHVAPAIQGEIKNWFEAAGWTRAEDWPKIAEAILSFL
jgi:hypothetical protein